MDPSLLGRPSPPPYARRSSPVAGRGILFAIIGVIIAVIIGTVLLVAGGDKSGTLRQQVSARQATTIKIIDDGQKNLTNDDLTKLNSELSLVLKSDAKLVSTALATAGLKKVDKKITAAEADTATFQSLTSAKLNATYDETYRRTLATKLESLQVLIRELHGATKSSSLKSALNTEHEHLTLYLASLQKLSN